MGRRHLGRRAARARRLGLFLRLHLLLLLLRHLLLYRACLIGEMVSVSQSARTSSGLLKRRGARIQQRDLEGGGADKGSRTPGGAGGGYVPPIWGVDEGPPCPSEPGMQKYPKMFSETQKPVGAIAVGQVDRKKYQAGR